MKYSLFIGRYQPWHDGHRWLIEQRLKEGKNVCIAIRNEHPDETHEWYSGKISSNIQNELNDLIKEGRAEVIVIPDIESVNYGRGVGYEVIEHFPPTDIKEISATKIRAKLNKSYE